jgi:hypothetical protein
MVVLFTVVCGRREKGRGEGSGGDARGEKGN